MAFTYSGDPGTSTLDYIRFMLGDTNEASVILQDAEINFIIASTQITNNQLASAFRAAATALGAKAVAKKLGPQTEDASARLKYYTAQAERYERLGKYSATPPLPDYQSDLVFEKGMMENDA